MLKKDNFSKSHIRNLQANSRRDPVLLERAVYAFGLLEALVRVGMPFVFKGGTCLMLLLDSPINDKPFYILLDVLFEENHYAETIRKAVRNELLLTEPEYLTVEIPSPDCILADKLTAFAPYTTGIPLGEGKDMEVMKQFYDVVSLLDVFTTCSKVLPTYKSIAEAEIEYRGREITPSDCLWDTYEAAFCIASRGKINSQDYPFYVRGIRDLRGHIYAENYSPEIAAVRAVKVMYIIMCLLTGQEYKRVVDEKLLSDQKITNMSLTPLRYMRKVNLEAYSYLIQLDEILIDKESIK